MFSTGAPLSLKDCGPAGFFLVQSSCMSTLPCSVARLCVRATCYVSTQTARVLVHTHAGGSTSGGSSEAAAFRPAGHSCSHVSPSVDASYAPPSQSDATHDAIAFFVGSACNHQCCDGLQSMQIASMENPPCTARHLPPPSPIARVLGCPLLLGLHVSRGQPWDAWCNGRTRPSRLGMRLDAIAHRKGEVDK